MNQAFFPVYKQLISNSETQDAKGLWLAHGEEPLLTQWIVDGLRPIWQRQQQSVTRIDLASAKTWQEVIAELNSMSLFDPGNAIIVTGNHKPDKIRQEQLLNFAQECTQGQSDNHLLWITPKQDKRALSAKWAQPFNQNGLVVDCNIYNEKQRLDILQTHANIFGLTLSQDAWQLLMSHTQNHLLSAYQALWRLSYLFTVDTESSNTKIEIDIEKLQSALVSESSYSVFDLSDTMLSGNSQQVITIINGLKNTGEPPTLVLWAISQDVRRLQLLLSGKDPQSIGIWRNKQSLYQSAVNRQNIQQMQNWSYQLLKCDQAIKGIIKQPAWELLLQLALSITGVQLFNAI